MTSVHAYLAMSVDGYIARSNGKVDWLGDPTPAAMADFQRLMDSVDAVVMGRNTYETVAGLGAWPYAKPVFVLTSRPLAADERVAAHSGEPSEVVRTLADRGLRRLYVDGGATVRGFMRAGVVTRLTLTTVPILLGEGIPLFLPTPEEVRLRHTQTRELGAGMVQSTYELT